MIIQFLNHQWKEFRRSASFERELGITILLGFIYLGLFISLLGVAGALPRFLYEMPGIEDPIILLNQGLVYYFVFELVLRYLMQTIPALDIQPYLLLPVSKSKIASFLTVKSLFSPINSILLILIYPFTTEVLQDKYGSEAGWLWLISAVGVSFSLHFLNILIKKRLENFPLFWAVVIGIAISNYILSTFFSIDILAPIGSFFLLILEQPWLSIIPLGALVILSVLAYRFLRENLYLEEILGRESEKEEALTSRLNFLQNSTIENTLMLQEIKLVIRHKRTRMMLITSLLLVGYGLIFFGKEEYAGPSSFKVFLGVFMTSLFTINYGQYFWSWYTNQLDFYFTQPVALSTWIKSRYRLLVIACLISLTLSLPYVYFGWDVLLLMVCGAVYNIGINVPLIMRIAMWGPKGIDLNKKDIFNYGGAGAAQFLMGFPLLIGPYVFYVPVNIFFGYYAGLVAVGLAGVVGFIFRDYFLQLLEKKLISLKYLFVKKLTL